MRLNRSLASLMRRAALLLALLAVPVSAYADILLTPFVGWNSQSSGMARTTNLGLAAGWFAANGLGIEGEFANIASPFPDGRLDDGTTLDTSTNYVWTLMGNVAYAPRVGAVAPYVTGGLGRMTIRYAGFLEPKNNFAMNVGGGVRVGTGRLAIRGDVRYFRTITEQTDLFQPDNPPAFDYWRGAVGLSIGF